MEKKVLVLIITLALSFIIIVPAQSHHIIDAITGPFEKSPGDMETDSLPQRPQFPNNNMPTPQYDKSKRDDQIVDLITGLNENIYLGYLEGLVAIGPRVTTTPEIQEASDYIYEQFSDMGLETRIHYWEGDTLFGNNIEATIPGIDETSDEIYVICAHYDTVPGSPGADDDGSGTVAVISAAYLMKDFVFNHTIKFVTFSGEEQGLHGSYHYVLESLEQNHSIAGVLNLDMIGFAPNENDDDAIHVFEGEYTDLLDLTIDVSEDYNDIITLEIIPRGFSAGSDHYYFWQAGYPALFYAEENFNDFYHSSRDTIENMNIAYAVEVSQLAIAVLAEMAEITIIETPETPETPKGPTDGAINTVYTYTAVTTDPQNDQLYYLFDWGDDTSTEWIGPYESGQICNTTHTWTQKGRYTITVKAKDINGYESKWSEPLPITMPKVKWNYNIFSILRTNSHFQRLFPLFFLA